VYVYIFYWYIVILIYIIILYNIIILFKNILNFLILELYSKMYKTVFLNETDNGSFNGFYSYKNHRAIKLIPSFVFSVGIVLN